MSKSKDPYGDRIKQVFGTDEVPRVSGETLNIYFAFLKERIECPCILTGIESLGFFGWEARYIFGPGGREEEYKHLRQQEGSYKDHYELRDFDAIVDEEWDILVNVQRIPYRKRFEIPLSQLKTLEKTSPNYQLLDDYSVWYVNWR